jgi:ABC-type uncharacterized transport system auxiliary subunit
MNDPGEVAMGLRWEEAAMSREIWTAAAAARAAVIALLAALPLLVMGCGGTVPESRFYMLHYEVAPERVEQPIDLVLGVEPFSTQPLYRDRRIVYRVSENEVVYYPYRYWAAPPGELVADQLANHIRQVGLVRALEMAPFGRSPEWLLSGHVQEFDEVELEAGGAARLELIVRLESVTDRRILREETLAVEKPLAERSPDRVAEAMSAAVREAGERILDLIREEAARH